MIAAQVLPVSLSMPVLDTIKLLTVDDLVPKESPRSWSTNPSTKPSTTPVASLSLKEKTLVISDPILIVSNIAFYPSFESVSVLSVLYV